MRPSQLWELVHRQAAAAGITMAVDAGVPLRDVQDYARHRDARTTRRYDHEPVPARGHGVYRSRVLAVRDMRTANGRDPESGEGAGIESWIALALGMVVLDTLTPIP